MVKKDYLLLSYDGKNYRILIAHLPTPATPEEVING